MREKKRVRESVAFYGTRTREVWKPNEEKLNPKGFLGLANI